VYCGPVRMRPLGPDRLVLPPHDLPQLVQKLVFRVRDDRLEGHRYRWNGVPKSLTFLIECPQIPERSLCYPGLQSLQCFCHNSQYHGVIYMLINGSPTENFHS
jgi:hypothetical protein